MAIATKNGVTPWDTRDVSQATGVCVQRASRKLSRWEDRAVRFLVALAALDPTLAQRPDRMATSVTAWLTTGGKLAAYDAVRFHDRLEELIRRVIVDESR